MRIHQLNPLLCMLFERSDIENIFSSFKLLFDFFFTSSSLLISTDNFSPLVDQIIRRLFRHSTWYNMSIQNLSEKNVHLHRMNEVLFGPLGFKLGMRMR